MHWNMDRIYLTDCIHEYRPCRVIYAQALPWWWSNGAVDASPLAVGGWKRSMSPASLLNSSAACTVFWLLRTWPRAKFDWNHWIVYLPSANLWESEPKKCIIRVWKIPRGNVKLYYNCKVNRPATDAAATGPTKRMCLLNQEGPRASLWECERDIYRIKRPQHFEFFCKLYTENVIYSSPNNDKTVWSRNHM